MSGRLLHETPADGVLRLRISNPARRGALTHGILDAIAEAVGNLDESVRCVLLTGEDGVFSSGYDIGDIPPERFAELAEPLVAHPYASAVLALDRCEVPVVAALSGHTIGGGLELALCCDLRIARDDIKLGMPPANFGLIYSHTGLQRFLDAIGEPRTRDLFLTGRYIDAATAERWGLVTEIVPAPGTTGDPDPAAHGQALDAAALALAIEVAGNAPLSVQGNKRVLRALLDEQRAIPAALEAELIQQRKDCFDSEDFREGIAAFAERRPARWQGR